MPLNDDVIFNTLVANQSNKNLLENLLSYNFYQITKRKIFFDFVTRFGYLPTEEFLHKTLYTQETIDRCRDDARSEIQAQILEEIEPVKSDSLSMIIVEKALLDFASASLTNIAIWILKLLLITLATYFGFFSLFKTIINLFPSFKELICE